MRLWLRHYMRGTGKPYIFPTRLGGYFNGLIFLLFLLAMGYGNNLLLIFTLLLFGLNLVWLIQTHFHLKALRLDSIRTSDGHASESIPVIVQWESIPEGVVDLSLTLEGNLGKCDLKNTQPVDKQNHHEVVINKRGQWNWEYLKVSTSRPFGLYRCWTYFPIKATSYAYPELLKGAQPPLFNTQNEQGEESSSKKGDGDFYGLTPYTSEETRKISWKHYAQSGQLLIKEGELLRAPEASFKWIETFTHKEEKLSLLATQMVYCGRENIAFSFQTTKGTFGPTADPQHLRRCLRELSLC